MVQSLPAEPVPEDVDVAHELARFVSRTTYDGLPPDAIERAKKSVLDLIAVTVHGSRSESAEAFGSYVLAQGGHPEASILCSGRRTTAYFAALLNGTYAHATELSETFTRAVVHPGNVILPALLAMGEREHASGRTLITGTALGYEVLIRFGLSVGVPWMMEQGFHTPSAVGAFGSTAGCAALLGLDPDQTRNAFGIAACYTPTTLRAAFKGATIKEMFEGSAAATGVMAGDLARLGITGVWDWDQHWHDAVTRRHGMLALVDGLGERWMIETGGLHFKIRAVVAMGQPVLDAVEHLVRKNRVDPDDVVRIVVESTGRVMLGGTRSPETIVAAKASVPYLAAFGLVYPDALAADPHLVRSLTADVLKDGRVARLAELVEMRVDPQIDRDFEVSWPMKFGARVTVETKDGSRIEEYADVWPYSSNMTFDQVAAKFSDVVGGLVDKDNEEQIVESVRRLELIDDISEVVRLVSSVTSGVREAAAS
jgi:2-methylcitrate dehydratase PrpD